MNAQTQIAEYQNEIVRLMRSNDYCNEMILNNQTKNWERKEYQDVIDENNQEIKLTKAIIERIKRIYPNG
jgi:hypothetical protein